MKRLSVSIFILICTIFLASAVSAQVTLPRSSQKATVMQTIGDTNVTIVYSRPNVKGRKVWGELVKYNEVWRTGADEATTFDVTNDVTINGQNLPKGKYSFHSIPVEKGEWTLIFNKVAEQWGSFNYDAKQDALRIKVMPVTSKTSRESLMYEFENVTKNNANVVISWEKLQIPFAIDVGDVNGRTMSKIREALKDETSKTYRQVLISGANFIFNEKMTANYAEALDWVEKALKIQENFGGLRLKALLLAETGKSVEAVPIAERALELGKASTPPANAELMKNLEADIAKWKAKK